MFIQRYTLTPSLGKATELRPLVEARVKKSQSEGLDVSLSLPMAGDVPSLVVTYRFNSLTDLEKLRAHTRSDKDWQEYFGKWTSIATAKIELSEVLIPFPTR